MITILITSQNPKKKPWSWLLIRWCTWGVSKENWGLITSGIWDTCKLDFAEFHLPYLHYYCTPNACFPDFSFSLIVVLMSPRVPKALQKYWKLKCVSIWGAISWAPFRPFTNERNRITEQHYLGFRAQARNYFGILAWEMKHFWLRVGTIFKHCGGVLYLKFVKQLVWWSSTRRLG
jgi:hypothetical protein